MYYKNLRLKRTYKKRVKKEPKLSAQETIILTQHIQMKCFEKRIKQKKCKKLLSKNQLHVLSSSKKEEYQK